MLIGPIYSIVGVTTILFVAWLLLRDHRKVKPVKKLSKREELRLERESLVSRVVNASQTLSQYHNSLNGPLHIKTVVAKVNAGLKLDTFYDTPVLTINEVNYDWYIIDQYGGLPTFIVVGLGKKADTYEDRPSDLVFRLGKHTEEPKAFLEKLDSKDLDFYLSKPNETDEADKAIDNILKELQRTR